MGGSRNIHNNSRLRKPLFLLALLGGILLIIAIPGFIQKIVKSGTNAAFDNEITNRDETAIIVASNHFKAPQYKEVYKHTSSIRNLNAYLKTLDPYSKYMTSEGATFLEKRHKKYRLGIGLDLLVNGEKILGVPVIQGPAYKAGMVRPAYVRAINNRKIVYRDFSSYSFLVELAAGELVRLSLEDNNNLDKAAYTIKAANHTNSSVSSFAYRDTLFIRINKFVGGENSELKTILDTAEKYKRLVIDLRYCPGGDLYAMVDMLSFILRDNLNVAYLQKANGKNELTLKTLPGRIIADTPLYVLVSEFTASTAEIFVWAIKRNYPGAWVLGEPTKGKCLAQNVFPFHDGSALNLTTYEVRNSFNQSCQGHPLVVDKLIPGIVLSNRQELFNILTAISYHADGK